MSQYVIPPLPPDFSLTPISPPDMPFLCWLYGTTRTDLAPVPWTDEQKNAFIAMQFNAQHEHYQTHFPHVGYYMLSYQGERAGRLYVDWERGGQTLHLMDVTLAPALRRQGHGTALMRWLMAEAARRRVPMTLYVEDFNPAYRLYQRLGFEPTDQHGIYTHMKWIPSTP